MSLQRISYPDRETWLQGRKHGLGGSDAASVVGLSKWRTSVRLWEEKTGRVTPGDSQNAEYKERGTRMEDAIRRFFEASYAEFEVFHHPYDILFQSERPFLFATLDAELLRKSDSAKGVLEIKTATPQGRAGFAEWNGKIPQGYYAQVLHQLLATGYSFAVLYAALYGYDESVTLKRYDLDRLDCEADLIWLAGEEEKFWHCVETGVNPGATLRF